MAARTNINGARRITSRNEMWPPANCNGDFPGRYLGGMDEFGDPDVSALPTWKNIAVGVIAVACFASIYPKALHPLLMGLFGYGEQTNKATINAERATRRSGGASASYGLGPKFGDSAMPGASDRFPSAGARMAGPMAPSTQYTPDNTGGNGAWHWLLPFYTIGIVLFLLYTLGKVLWRKPNITARHRYNLRYNSEKDRFEAKVPGMESEEEDSEESERSMFDDDEVDELRGNFNERNHWSDNTRLVNLQQRLQETESAMQYILSQIEQLSSCDPSQVEHFKETATATFNSLKLEHDENNPATIFKQRNVGTSSSEKRKSRDRVMPPFLDTGESGYISDLEKALDDFKRSSEDYVRKHAKKASKVDDVSPVQCTSGGTEPDATAVCNDNEDTSGLDAMDSEQNSEIPKFEATECEISSKNSSHEDSTDYLNHVVAASKFEHIRQRKRRKKFP